MDIGFDPFKASRQLADNLPSDPEISEAAALARAQTMMRVLSSSIDDWKDIHCQGDPYLIPRPIDRAWAIHQTLKRLGMPNGIKIMWRHAMFETDKGDGHSRKETAYLFSPMKGVWYNEIGCIDWEPLPDEISSRLYCEENFPQTLNSSWLMSKATRWKESDKDLFDSHFFLNRADLKMHWADLAAHVMSAGEAFLLRQTAHPAPISTKALPRL